MNVVTISVVAKQRQNHLPGEFIVSDGWAGFIKKSFAGLRCDTKDSLITNWYEPPFLPVMQTCLMQHVVPH